MKTAFSPSIIEKQNLGEGFKRLKGHGEKIFNSISPFFVDKGWLIYEASKPSWDPTGLFSVEDENEPHVNILLMVNKDQVYAVVAGMQF